MLKFILNNVVVFTFVLQLVFIMSFFSPMFPKIPDPKINNIK